MGLSLTFEDFTKVFVLPKPTLTGLFSQILLLPAMAFLIAYLIPVDPEYKVGLILIAACPGGTTSNLVTFILKGRLALSITLTALNSLIITFSIPLIVDLGLSTFLGQHTEFDISFWNTLSNILFVTLIPTMIGVMLRRKFPEFAKKTKKPLRYVMPIILALIFVGVIFIDSNGSKTNIFDHMEVVPYLLILNISAMILSFFLSRGLKLRGTSQYTIAIEVGLQNSTLAIFVANTIIGSDSMTMIAVIYGAFSFFSTLIIASIMKVYVEHREKRRQK